MGNLTSEDITTITALFGQTISDLEEEYLLATFPEKIENIITRLLPYTEDNYLPTFSLNSSLLDLDCFFVNPERHLLKGSGAPLHHLIRFLIIDYILQQQQNYFNYSHASHMPASLKKELAETLGNQQKNYAAQMQIELPSALQNQIPSFRPWINSQLQLLPQPQTQLQIQPQSEPQLQPQPQSQQQIQQSTSIATESTSLLRQSEPPLPEGFLSSSQVKRLDYTSAFAFLILGIAATASVATTVRGSTDRTVSGIIEGFLALLFLTFQLLKLKPRTNSETPRNHLLNRIKIDLGLLCFAIILSPLLVFSLMQRSDEAAINLAPWPTICGIINAFRLFFVLPSVLNDGRISLEHRRLTRHANTQESSIYHSPIPQNNPPATMPTLIIEDNISPAKPKL